MDRVVYIGTQHLITGGGKSQLADTNRKKGQLLVNPIGGHSSQPRVLQFLELHRRLINAYDVTLPSSERIIWWWWWGSLPHRVRPSGAAAHPCCTQVAVHDNTLYYFTVLYV